ncbi:hypothetical protein LMB56_05375 [Limosilactobacillus reuteri]|uniref:hypothetical protein n=1 Tax=Limosilactobacillus reuteri TaxID=1598 RepID=UPI001E510C9C|nr:hypothetical protein [Limosilactobacillus reuteri]MCC4435858.1 hypothetical protein [Limosilactobacillus reuteri]MCC4438178.1 hypothetical protein [Limosilactobacillus reuteri]MCC4442632.1 hypothetical protein [Limosilactobacillus reuteri]MCC4444246.1 hypothetical protein [Limosilactobacillus reuteri]MCC4445932.1 hypothetical protein [Limosilactobacillus reuteri]
MEKLDKAQEAYLAEKKYKDTNFNARAKLGLAKYDIDFVLSRLNADSAIEVDHKLSATVLKEALSQLQDCVEIINEL